MKIKNNTLAIPADAVITPPKPSTPAINAMTKNVSAQVSMTVSDLIGWEVIDNSFYLCNACAVLCALDNRTRFT